ncbi:restriction endonuclease subunit S [Leptospira interrogans]|uniref:restriction endonuclease subunit S n=1 Tax=Leptospira interrogans TaxID=173 RepID=UPI0002BA0C83|nr:restriction endonuclease subunit S [Leptospira interrogans]MCR8646987.1 restriction endonuclease subunit S [Leptospira interrogans serovar Bataviae]OAM84350.1 restriction endonuclease subunit S [Leptospira interrogans serovar Bataviae]QOI39362.1 restriction endonuclease subunit S [Leptospira interrogans serovar Bataviae]QYY59630.1 restriction endonuclease subunit S [Leptospira interrogans serovar Bataviae]
MEKLLKGAKVEWKALGEVIISNTGGGTPSKAKSEYWNGEIPWASVGDLSIDGHFIKKTRNHVTSEGLKDSSSNLISKGDVIVAVKISPGKMKIAGIDLAINQDLRGLKLKDEISAKFLNYYFQILILQGTGTIVKAITSKDLEKIQIPIPPLPVQVEIVRILDAFTELTTELTAELTARKKQYNYYRDQLLSFDEGEVEWRALGETLVRTKGTNITAGQMKELNKYGAPLKVFAGGRTVAFVNFEDIPAKDVNREPSIIVKSRGVIEFEYYDKPFSHKNEMWSYHSKNEGINIKYVYYFLKMNEPYFRSIGSKMQMPQIATPDTDKFQIPIPPLAEQERIVAILDKFDALTSSISEGLPREIRLRQKQYEHYRELLLSFPKAEVGPT